MSNQRTFECYNKHIFILLSFAAVLFFTLKPDFFYTQSGIPGSLTMLIFITPALFLLVTKLEIESNESSYLRYWTILNICFIPAACLWFRAQDSTYLAANFFLAFIAWWFLIFYYLKAYTTSIFNDNPLFKTMAKVLAEYIFYTQIIIGCTSLILIIWFDRTSAPGRNLNYFIYLPYYEFKDYRVYLRSFIRWNSVICMLFTSLIAWQAHRKLKKNIQFL
ncbi:MAG: hypothetical protein MK193_09935 [Lentisphaeria bacterium]|nr:hypothetical protein [Lentisphaeria bacterium]